MLIEHVFVTTLDAQSALVAARDFLMSRGYQVVNRTDSRLEVRRGKQKPAQARRVDELPQRILMQFDRGRIELALSIQEQRKAGSLHSELLVSTAKAIETLLTTGRSPDDAAGLLRSVSDGIDLQFRRRRRSERVIGVIALLVVLGMIALAVMVASSI